MPGARQTLLISSLVFTLLVTALAGVSIYRKVATFQPLGFSARPAGAGWVVQGVDDPASGLRPGDQIFQIEGREITDLARQLQGQAHSELLVTRGDELVQVPYIRPPLEVDYPFLVLTLIGTAYLLIGLYTLFQQGGRPGALFYLWCLASAIVYLYTPATPVADAFDKAVYLVEELARIWLPALTLHLFLIFPERLTAGARLRRLLPFVYLPAAVFTTLQADLVFNDGRLLFARRLAAAIWALDTLELVHLVAFGLAAVGVLAVRLRRHREWEQHRQVQLVAFGTAAGYLPFAVFYLVPRLFGLQASTLLGAAAVVPLTLVPLAFAWAILRYKLWDIEVLVRDTISSTLTLMLGLVGFSLLQLAIGRGLPDELAMARNFLSIVAGLTIAGLMIPARQGLAAGIERLQYRGSFLQRQALTELADDLMRERDLVRLAGNLVDRIEEGIPLSRANLYLIAGARLRPVRPETGAPGEIAPDALGEEIWEEEIHPISAAALPSGHLTAAQRLFIAGYRYAFPLTVLDHHVGLLVAGYKPEQNPLNSDDIELIRQLLDQASLAIENAQLLDQLQQRLDEVVRLQNYSEGIFESSPAGIVVLDAADRVVSANAAFATLIPPREERGETPAVAPRPRSLIGRRFEEILPIRPLPSPEQGLLEVSYCDRAGNEWYLQLSVSSFTRVPGRPLRIVVIHDVSERVAMENAIREKDRLAALGMLAAGVAHEVNTPITGISSYAQMLLAETDHGDPRYDLLKKVERQTFRAARIVNNLLEFARNKGSDQRPLDVVPLIGETLDLLKERFSRRSVHLDFQPPAGPAVVKGNGGELQQVLTNLFVNASDAMAEVGGTLRITVESGETAVQILVEDTGVGIPPERLKTIFQPFFSTKLTSGGTGLGLSISYEIVRRHGGDLRAESQPGKGSRFIVELPKAAESAQTG